MQIRKCMFLLTIGILLQQILLRVITKLIDVSYFAMNHNGVMNTWAVHS